MCSCGSNDALSDVPKGLAGVGVIEISKKKINPFVRICTTTEILFVT